MNPRATRSLRIVLATVGSRGDVQPMLALAQELAARGHVPVVAAPPNFELWVRSLGFEFEPLGTDMQAFLAANAKVMTGNPLARVGTVKRFFAEEVPRWVQQVAQACRGADAAVWAGLAVATPSVAEHLRIPALGVYYSSCMIPAGAHPPPSITRHGLPRWLNKFFWSFGRVVMQRLLGKPLNAGRAAIGLPPASVYRHMWEQGPYVLALDEALFPPDADWPPGRFPYANHLYFDDPAPLDADLLAWLDDGEPPVFVGFGSMSGQGIDRVGRLIVEAVSATGRRCIVGAGWSGLGDQGQLPPGWRVVLDAPHALLFPRMAAVVHHGGAGTTAQVLRAGVPQVILPLILDQYHHAHRLHLAGLIPRPVPMERVTAPELTDAIRRAIELPRAPREAVSARLRASNGRGQVADRLEAACAATAGA